VVCDNGCVQCDSTQPPHHSIYCRAVWGAVGGGGGQAQGQGSILARTV
jgi:hypothetical protein